MNYGKQHLKPADQAGFNPHSPLLANEFRALGRLNHFLVVSIHIRHCWRMNGVAHNLARKRVEFQSTFAIAGE